MPIGSWTIRQAGPEDMDAIRALYLDVWGYNRPRSFDHWRYLSGEGGICPMTLAVDGEKLAGAYTVWPASMRLAGDIVPGAQSMDTMTHPDYQGQGVFTKLAQACYEIAAGRSMKILYGFPNPLSYPGFVKHLGWTHTGDVTHWVRLIRPSGHPKIPGLAGPFADLAARLLPRGRKRGFEITTERPADDALQALLAQGPEEGGICGVERSPAWLDWRYAEDAENDYAWVAAYKGGNLAALGIWGRQNAAWGQVADNRAHLVELLGADPTALQAVLSATITHAEMGGALLLETVCNIDPICRALRRAGFYRHRLAPFIVRGLGPESAGTNILDHGNWRIMGGDVDTF
ncbi:MAG: GNAT family N-acetyltransferase [Rhodospirillales bacterium]|jgi:GNAT superfamily N-acetyltransferase|nr:GNAT family N-acetyltransferase [Rhodospirillales bacterium]